MLQNEKVLDTNLACETSLLDYSDQRSCHIIQSINILSINCMFITFIEIGILLN